MNLRIVFSSLALLAFAVLSVRAEVLQVRGREKPVTGPIVSEDAKGVVVNVTGKKGSETIPAVDVIDIYYDNVKPFALTFPKGAYRDAREAEKAAEAAATAEARKTALAKAIAKYQETLKVMLRETKGQVYAARHFEYKVALLTLKQARAELVSSEKAVAALNSFKSKFPNSWQINFVMPTLAQLHEDAMDYKQAKGIFQEVSEMEFFPPEVRSEAELKIVEINVRAGDITEANRQLNSLAKKAAGNPAFSSRVQMARAGMLVSQKKLDEAVPILKQIVKDNSDRKIKALAHNTLGECLFKAQKYNEALWEFLWVDAVFNQDVRQHAKALYYLGETFEKLNNAERAQECREMLLSDRQFAGTEYQRMLAAKSK